MQSATKREQDIIKRYRKKYFKDHETVRNMDMVYWRKPGTVLYGVTFVIIGSTLFVDGDLGSAVYRWGSPIDWQDFSHFSLHYFAEKCQASEVGRFFKEWDAGIAEDTVMDAMRQRYEEHLLENGGDAEFEDSKHLEFWETAGGKEALDNPYDLNNWIDEHRWYEAEADDMIMWFGSDWEEWLPTAGDVIHNRCIAHWVAAQMVGEALDGG